jgi:hypothetical protein
VAAGVEVGLQISPQLLGPLGVWRTRRPALAVAGDGVESLQHQVLSVLERLHPDMDAFLGHGNSFPGEVTHQMIN